MNTTDIRQIIENRNFPGKNAGTVLEETHASWVILTPEFAYKIKKPLRYTFLDFSTLEKRRTICEREVELNRRLTEGIYIGVVPIREFDGKLQVEGTRGQAVEYAVKMKRLDNSRQMNLLLEKNEVTHRHLHQLAEKLAAFHARAEKVAQTPDIQAMQTDFADLSGVAGFLSEQLGESAAELVSRSVAWSAAFLASHEARLLERHRLGFVIDGHGDLHSKNIFLLDVPVIFDCIEFSDHFRQSDVLNELAFFCMDLDAFDRQDLASVFLQYYLALHPCMSNEEDRGIFDYFKLYRANVRLKVNALKAMQAGDEDELKKRTGLVISYFDLFGSYFEKLTRAKSIQP
jgi:hypothetical protein